MALSKPINAVQQLLFKITSDGSLRGTTTPDKGEIFSVIDYITKVCRKTDGGAYARATYSALIKEGSVHRNEILRFVYGCKLPGSSGPATPCTDIRGLQRLLTILGGKVSEEYRALLNDTFLRYIAGDRTMITEIEDNASSNAPMQVLARDALSRAAAVEGPAAAPAIEPSAEADDQDETRTVSDDTPEGSDADDDERMMIVRGIATELKAHTVVAQQQATNISQLSGVIEKLIVANVHANAATEKERSLRHQADGRYGSGIREATKEVRKRAAEADARAAAADARAAEDRRQHHKAIQEATMMAAEERRAAAACHQLLADTLAKLVQHFAPNNVH